MRAMARNLFAAWLASERLSYSEFGRRVGVDRARIQRCATGERGPGLELALLIDEATDGKVPAASWVANSPSKRSRSRRRAA